MPLSEDPFWEQKIRSMLVSHLPQSPGTCDEVLIGGPAGANISRQKITKKLHIFKCVLVRVAAITAI